MILVRMIVDHILSRMQGCMPIKGCTKYIIYSRMYSAGKCTFCSNSGTWPQTLLNLLHMMALAKLIYIKKVPFCFKFETSPPNTLLGKPWLWACIESISVPFRFVSVHLWFPVNIYYFLCGLHQHIYIFIHNPTYTISNICKPKLKPAVFLISDLIHESSCFRHVRIKWQGLGYVPRISLKTTADRAFQKTDSFNSIYCATRLMLISIIHWLLSRKSVKHSSIKQHSASIFLKNWCPID